MLPSRILPMLPCPPVLPLFAWSLSILQPMERIQWTPMLDKRAKPTRTKELEHRPTKSHKPPTITLNPSLHTVSMEDSQLVVPLDLRFHSIKPMVVSNRMRLRMEIVPRIKPRLSTMITTTTTMPTRAFSCVFYLLYSVFACFLRIPPFFSFFASSSYHLSGLSFFSVPLPLLFHSLLSIPLALLIFFLSFLLFYLYLAILCRRLWIRATGKKCSKYVCSHSVDSATTNQVGPNYNINNAFTSANNQYGPNYAQTYNNQNTAGNVISTPYAY